MVVTGIRRGIVWLALFALLVSLAAPPAGAAAAPVALRGHVPTREIAAAQDLGPLVDSAPLTLTLALAPRQPQALAALLHAQYTPGSPGFHQFLSTAQFAIRFGATTAQLQAVTSWLQSQGLSVRGVAANRLFVKAAGSAVQVGRALGVRPHHYLGKGGATFSAPPRDPQIPSSLAGIVRAVHGLTTLPAAAPHLERRTGVVATPPAANGAIKRPAPAPGKAPLPASATPVGLTPAGIRTAYDLAPAYSNGIDGTGQTMAVFELDGYTAADIAGYEQTFGLPAVPLQNVLVDGAGGGAGSNAAEVTLDLELQLAVAPGASRLLVYEGPNSDAGVVDTYARIANDDLATSISTSWGLCEPFILSSTMQSQDTIFAQMAAQGQSIFAASGDSGAKDCGGSQLAVDYPASDPWMTGVGGTHLNLNSNGSYGSETAWDGTCASGPCAGGGGVSTTWPQPAWQTGPGVQNQFSTGKREVPDVSLNADPSTGYAIYLGGSWLEFGGTSAAAPIWAAWSALANEYAAAHGRAHLGFAAPALYQIGGDTQQYSLTLHDVTQGTNGYYPATFTYDLATGWGSFDGWNLLRATSGSLPTLPVVTAISPTSGPTSGGTTVKIVGVNLSGTTAVRFGTVAAQSFTVTSAISITAVTPAESQGVVDVTVTTASGASSTAAADRFAFLSGTATTSEAVAYQMNPGHSGATQFNTFLPTMLQQWTVDLGGNVSYPLIAQGKVYVTVQSSATTGKRLVALDETNGQIAWQVPLPGTYGFVNAAYDGGRIFVVNSNGLLQAFDAGTGASQWAELLPGQYLFSSAPTATTGIVYVGGAGSGGTVYAVSESNGMLLWTAPVANGDSSSPAVTADGVYVSYSCPQVYKFNPVTGTRLWSYSGPCEGGGGRTPVYYSGRLYVRDEFGSPLVFNAQTGSVVGSFAAGPTPAFVGNIRLALNASTLEATDQTTGTLIWSFTGDGTLTSAPIIINQTAFVGGSSGALYALDTATGRQAWSANVGSPILAPDEHNEVVLTGLGAGEGLLVVPASSKLVAFASTPSADIGGHNLRLTMAATGTPNLAWDAGASQTGYAVVRASSSGTVLLPTGATLPAGATSYSDTSNLTDPVYCYAVAALNGSALLGNSDVLCAAPGSRSATGAPPAIALQLNQTDIATFNWIPPGGQSGYVLVAAPLTPGAAQRTIDLPGAATSATDNTGGTFTCYELVATQGATALGNSDVLCADPGQATLPFVTKRGAAVQSSAAPTRTLAQLRARIASVITRLGQVNSQSTQGRAVIGRTGSR